MGMATPLRAEEGVAPARHAMLLAGVLILAAVARFHVALGTDHPLGDGGMFASLVDDIRRAGAIPPFATYNGLDLPFVYPPLGFVIGALLSSIPGLSTDLVLRLWPATLPTLAVTTEYWAALNLLRDRWAALTTTALLAVTPAAFDWLVAAAGLTRSLGTLLALAAVAVAATGLSGAWRGLLAGGLLGLTVLSHPQAAVFAASTLPFAWRARAAGRPRAVELGLTVLAAVAACLPWLLMLGLRGQLDDLLAVGGRLSIADGFATLVSLRFSGIDVFNIAMALAVVGVAAELGAGRWLLPAWLVVEHLLGAPPFLAAIPWAVVGGSGLVSLASAWWASRGGRRQSVSRWAGAVVIGISTFAVAGALTSDLGESSKQRALTPSQRAAAEWSRSLPDVARVAILTSQPWGDDLFGEWFPALSGMQAVTTVQGSEWLGRDAFRAHVARHEEGERCARSTAACLVLARSTQSLAATHYVIPRDPLAGPLSPGDCCPALRDTMRNDQRFHFVYDGPGTTVARWDGP